MIIIERVICFIATPFINPQEVIYQATRQAHFSPLIYVIGKKVNRCAYVGTGMERYVAMLCCMSVRTAVPGSIRIKEGGCIVL